MKQDICNYVNIVAEKKLFYPWQRMNIFSLFLFKKRLINYLIYLFSDTDFQNKLILDIGGGSGFISLFAAYMGAKHVICLEPESDGSTNGACNVFKNASRMFSQVNVELLSYPIQDYNPLDKKFDIVILHNSINHLDELACINLKIDDRFRYKYVNIFDKIKNISAQHAKVLIADCSCNNLFSASSMKNPLAKTIEWHKHHAPETWISILKEAGFCNPVVRWSPISIFGSSRLGYLGRWITSRKFISYMLISHFTISMENDDIL